MDGGPIQTIYCRNLPEKMNPSSVRKSLYMIFSEFGKIMEIKNCRAGSLKGQAWIVFKDIPSATEAMNRRQGFNFYGKPLQIEYAKSKSDSVARMDGTYKPRPKKEKKEVVSKKRSLDTSTESANNGGPAPPSGPPPTKAPKLKINDIPHRILFAQALPPDTSQDTLVSLFQPYPGFMEVRMVPGKKELAFIEFAEVVQAGIALQQLNGFKLNDTEVLHLTYGNQ